MTQGFVHDRPRRTDAAISADRAALAADPGAYPAANDLGVELAREHHDKQAARALRQAVGAKPAYALAWFNLGVVLSRMGPRHAPAAQGAFAHAFRLDGSLRDRPHHPMIDEGVYRTGLDVSRPLPAAWSLSRVHTGTPVPAVGLLAAILLALGLARLAASGADADAAKA
jgi:tetratricopeptide (TPR) repeat protein